MTTSNEAADLLAELGRATATIELLRIALSAREAQLRHAQARLRLLGHPAADVESVCSGLEASGAATVANWWDGFGDAEAIITVTPGREAEVDAAMLAIGFYPVGVPVPLPDGMARYYSTDGTPPWEAP